MHKITGIVEETVIRLQECIEKEKKWRRKKIKITEM